MSTKHSFERYGGLVQLRPLTATEREYDDTCRAIDFAEKQIMSKPVTLLTVGELLWFSHFVNKVSWFPTQEKLNQQLAEVGSLLKTLETREKHEKHENQDGPKIE